jgi:hypothetical protein
MLISKNRASKLEELLDEVVESLTAEDQAEFKSLTARISELMKGGVTKIADKEEEKEEEYNEFEYAFETATRDIQRHALFGIRNHTNTLLIEITKIGNFVGYKFSKFNLNEEETGEEGGDGEDQIVRGSALDNWMGAMIILEDVLEAYMVTYAQEEEIPELDERMKKAYEDLTGLLEQFRHEKFPIVGQDQFIILLIPTVMQIAAKACNLWTRTDFSKQYAYQNFCKKFDKMVEDCFKDTVLLIKNARRFAA